jgi:oligopeptide transport system permease protein
MGTIITGSILVIPSVIFSETSLSYLGIINLNSAQMTSIGAMLSEGQSCMTTAPHVVLFPALFIALLMISFNLFGNGLRDAFNPSTRGVD